MNETTFDALTRHAGSMRDRRASLKALGAAAVVAAVAAPSTGEAKKSASKKAKKKCKKQVGPCNTFATEVCDLFLDPADPAFDTCVTAALSCCPSLKKCAATSFFDCALVVIADLLPS